MNMFSSGKLKVDASIDSPFAQDCSSFDDSNLAKNDPSNLKLSASVVPLHDVQKHQPMARKILIS